MIRVIPRPFAALAAALLVTAPFGELDAQARRTTKQRTTRRASAPTPPAYTKGATVEGITEYTFPNGLRVLLFPDQTKPTVTVNVTYLVGSRHEGYGETGMAHLLEHMLFKGSPAVPDPPKALEARGAQYNGTTSFDRTNYYETLPATDMNLDWALAFEADRMTKAFIRKADLEKEFTVVRNEFEAGENNPTGVLFKRMLAVAFDWHNYGNLPIGARADIEGVPVERLQAFYQRYYQPDNAILVVAGKFDETKALTRIAATLGKVPTPKRSLATGNLLYPTYTRDATQDGERSVTLRRAGDVQVTGALYHVPAATHPDFPAVEVLAQVLGDAPSGRLYTALVESKLAATAASQAFGLREPGALLALATVRNEDDLAKAEGALLATLEGLAQSPITAVEVERAKTALLKNIDLNLNNAQQSAIDLSEWASLGDWRLLFIARDRLERVTADDVNRVAAAYLKGANRTVGRFLPTASPDRAEIAEAPPVEPLVKDYKGRAAVAQGEAFDPSPLAVERRTTRTALANGFELALLPKATRGNSVVAQVTLRVGSPATLQGQAAVASLTAAMLQRGTTSKTRQELKDAFDKLKARTSVTGAQNSVTARVETTRENLLPALRLLGEVLRSPAFDSTEFRILKEQQLAQLEQQRSDPQARAITAIQRQVDPRPQGAAGYVPTIEENIALVQAATLDDVRAFHRDFYGAQAGSLAAVGDFDAAALAEVATALFGGWTAPTAFARIPSPYQAVRDTTITIETPDKANAFLVAGLTLPIGDDHPDYPALVLGAYIFGGSPLGSRLVTRVRQKEGLSYGAGAQFVARAMDPSALMLMFAIFAPENGGKLEAATRDEFRLIATQGITEEELQQGRNGWLQQQQQLRANDGQLASQLGQQLYADRTMAFDAELEAKVKALTAEQVNAAMRKHFAPASLVLVKAGDFEGAAKKAAGQVKP
jgi:zinc protease